MFLENKIQIIINPSNIKHYSKFYNNLKVKDKIFIFHNELTKSSNALIKVKCDEYGMKKEIKFKNYNKYGYKNGNYLCRSCKLKLNNLKKYGVENVFQIKEIKEKSKNTIKDKYGVENISQLEEVKKKKIKTNIKKYGVEWGLSSDEIKEKSKNTIRQKYGVENISQLKEIKIKKENTCYKNYNVNYISQSEEFKERLKKLNYNKYGVEYIFQNEEIKNKISDSVLNNLHRKMFEINENLIKITTNEFILKCEICKKEYKINKSLYYKRKETNTILCTICNPINKNIYGLEKELQNFIKEIYNKKIILNSKKIIFPYELDVFLPDLNLAFEFNGVYWHNEINKPKNYHKMKYELCKSKNIFLFQIWEDDWNYKKDLIKSMIMNKLNKNNNKIYARNCEIREVNDINLIRNFLNNNHIQGFSKSKYKIGLFFNNELISLMTFGKSRNNNLELLRFCNKKYMNIIGGASKLFNYFIKKYNLNNIVTYADKCYSNGNLYEKLNFKLIGNIKPEYYYVIDGVKKHKSNFKKSNLIKEKFDSNKSEHQIMLERNIFRLYNAGYLKYIFNIY